MLRNPQRSPALFHYLRVLDIPSFYEFRLPGALVLAEILSHSHHLEELDCSKELLSYTKVGWCDELASALTHLSKLRSLRISDAYNVTLDWVKELDAPILEIELVFFTGCIHEPLPAILNLSSTLTKLHLSAVSFTATPTSSFCFPHVHTLTAELGEITPALVIFRIFPSIKSLDIMMHFEEEHTPPDDEEIRREHISNKETLDQGFPKLPSLDYLCGEPTDLYRSALICPATEWYTKSYDGFSAQWLFPVIRHIRPRLLDFFFDFCLWRNLEGADMYILETTFRQAPITTTLECLVLRVMFGNDPVKMKEIIVRLSPRCIDIPSDTKNYMMQEKLPGFIGEVPVETLKLKLHENEDEDEDKASVLEDVIIRRLGSDLFSNTPTLRNLIISPSSGKKLFGSKIDHELEFLYFEAGNRSGS